MAKCSEKLSVLEICAGGGGQAYGLEQAGFDHTIALEIEPIFAETLRLNRTWNVVTGDIQEFDGRPYKGIDLLAGGMPCPPFSIAGKQLGTDDERDLFPAALRLVAEAKPTAVLLENVRGLAGARFKDFRRAILADFYRMDYASHWQILNASEYSVPQLRPRFILVALKKKYASRFRWPTPLEKRLTVGQAVGDLMAERGWLGALRWAAQANGIAPTIVGGSLRHGGPDLGPTRARAEWLRMSVNGLGIANEAPGPDAPLEFIPKLTIRMVARLQGFPDNWQFVGNKTAQYRQIGNAFPAPVAAAVGRSIRTAITGAALTTTHEDKHVRELALV